MVNIKKQIEFNCHGHLYEENFAVNFLSGVIVSLPSVLFHINTQIDDFNPIYLLGRMVHKMENM